VSSGRELEGGVNATGGKGVQAGDRNVQVNVTSEDRSGPEVHGARDAFAAGRDLTVNHYHGDAAQPTHSVMVRVGDVPGRPPGFQPRAELLSALDAPGPGVLAVHAVTGMRGVGKTQLAAAYARAKLAAGWRLVAWVNAEAPDGLAGGLAAIAEAAGLTVRGNDPGLPVRYWLEAGGDRCLVVFDNAADPDVLRPYLPVAGLARVIVTSSRGSVAELGEPVEVEVFSPSEAVAFLRDRTGLADPARAAELAAELGFLPLGLAQAAAVIRRQRLGYGAYLERLRALPIADYLTPAAGQAYPHGVAEAVLLSLQAVQANDQSGACIGVMELLSVLSAAGARRDLLHAAGHLGAVGSPGTALGAAAVDEALGRLGEWSLCGVQPQRRGHLRPPAGLANGPGPPDRHAGGCLKNWDPGRQIDRRTAPSGVSRIGGQTGTQDPDLTPQPPRKPGRQGRSRKHYPHPPCRIFAFGR
jgi:hypothetical protein